MTENNSYQQLNLFDEQEYFTPDTQNINESDDTARAITLKNFDYVNNLRKILEKYKEQVDFLVEQGYHGLDEYINSNKNLGFEEGFAIILFASISVNPHLQEEILDQFALGSAYKENPELLRTHAALLMKSIATIESKIGLKPELIAGLVAACLEIDTICRIKFNTNQPIFGFGGMGGDKGLKIDSQKFKTGNTSTLASIILSHLFPVHKHHSRANTSKLGGQDVVEEMGYNSYMLDSESFQKSVEKTNLVFSSCHYLRFIHLLSHFIKGETINHIVGPLSIPHDRDQEICFVGGVNHNVHPQTEIETLIELEKRGIQKYSGAVSFCGLGYTINPDILEKGLLPNLFDSEKYYKHPALKNFIALDEVSPPPYPTLASFMVNNFKGEKISKTVMIYPSDFGLGEDEIDLTKIKISNDREKILQFNYDVLNGKNIDGLKYVCMSVALALFAQKHNNNPDAFLENRINPKLLAACYQEAICSFDGQKIQAKIQNFKYAEN